MGTSLITNHSAMTALQTLRQVSNGMDTTQKRVSTGLQIGEASDNTAYWSISSMMRSDRNALNSVASAMNLGKSQIDVAYETVEKSKSYLDDIQKALTTGYEKGDSDVKKIQESVNGKMSNIEASVNSASLAERNILGNDGQNVAIAGAYRREGSAVYVDMIDVGGARLNFAKPAEGKPGAFDLSEGVLKDVFGSDKDFAKNLDDYSKATTALTAAEKALSANTDATKAAELKGKVDAAKTAQTGAYEKMASNITVKDFATANFEKIDTKVLEGVLKAVQGKVTSATTNVVNAGAKLGAAKDQVAGQIDYVSKLMDAIDKGIGSLVDADMNAESARLSSLQVQQQLGIQALSIANQNSQSILSLFRG